MGKGIIIKESISDFALKEVNEYVQKQYDHLLDKKDKVIILYLEIPFDKFKELMIPLSKCILDKKYYMHFIFEDMMFVIYQSTISIINKNDETTIEMGIRIGETFGIKTRLLKFNELFTKDHPNE